MTLTVTAGAKLNLYLDITGRRDDGYHLLETVMQSISLSDVVTLFLEEGSGITVDCDMPSIPCDERNIAYKAAERYLKAAGMEKKVGIEIQKRIPSGAGMGGGSADAAAVLAGLDKMLGSPIDNEELYSIAADIGADVPFCLAGGTKICKGIGEEMSDTYEVKDCFFLVIMPDFTCPTGAAYGKYDEHPIPAKKALSEFADSVKNGSFAEKMYNVFEVLYADTRIEKIKTELIAAGARGAMLTGSGAAVFGVFDTEKAALNAVSRFPAYFTSVCRPVNKNIIFS